MIRHILKVNNNAEMQQAIASGLLQAPYICYEASSNVTNFVSEYGKEIPSVDYTEEESSNLIYIDGAYSNSYRGKYGELRTQISFPLVFKDNGNYLPRVLFVRKSNYDGALETFLSQHDSSTEADFIASLFTGQNEEGPIHPEYYFYADCLYPSDYPWGSPVTWISGTNWWGTGNWIPVPTETSEDPNDDKYVIVAAYCNPSTQHAVSGNAFKLGVYTVTPGMTGSARVVWEGIQEYAVDAEVDDSVANGRRVKIRVPANTLYDSVRYNAYMEYEGYTDETAITQKSGVRTATINQSTNFYFQDSVPFAYNNTSGNTTTGYLALQFYNSVTGVTSRYGSWALLYADPVS